MVMPYLIEPYNAYQTPPRKKHWMEIAEEEALYYRMVMEEQARQDQIQQFLVSSEKPKEAGAFHIPIVQFVSLDLSQYYILTEDGDIRITESGDIRIMEY